MKKLVLIAALVCFAAPSFAQTDSTISPARRRLEQIESMTVKKDKARKSVHEDAKLFKGDVLTHLSYGRHKVDADEFNNGFGPSHEVSFGVLGLSFNPAKCFSVRTGLDLDWNRYTKKKINGIESTLRTFAPSVPLFADLHFSAFGMDILGVRFGAGASFPITKYSSVVQKWSENGTEYTAKTPKVKTVHSIISYKAEIYAGAIGVYYKYCPDGFLDNVSYGTIGVSLIF